MERTLGKDYNVRETDEQRIQAFAKRIVDDGREFCEELYHHATVRLLAHKYAYYIKNCHFIVDIAYDGEEKSWYIMGRALGLLKEDETSPCVDFNENHPLAKEGIALTNTLVPRTD